MQEIFIYGDPRYLSGGQVGRDGRESYENSPGIVTGDGCTTEWCEKNATRNSSTESLLSAFGQRIHCGKSGYHSNVVHNKFLVANQWPSAGIELEMICSRKERRSSDRLVKDLHSNWFHFERDGSLEDGYGGEFGYELITEPLPPRIYRDPRTWIGLENILSPWFESFDHQCTGLHVHVGLNQFMDFGSIPIENKTSRMYIGKVMAMLVYFSIADASFVDRVCLRKQTRYCKTPSDRVLFEGTARLASGGMTGYEFIDLAVGKLVKQNMDNWSSNVYNETTHLGRPCEATPFCQANLCNTTSHGVEVNTEHRYTIEFRRAKGTIHSLSIHRVVELMTMIVRYAGKCCRCPQDKVSTKAFYEFVHDNTTSEPLRKLVEKTIAS